MNEQRGGPSAQNKANIAARVFRGDTGLHTLLLFQNMTLLEPSVLPSDDLKPLHKSLFHPDIYLNVAHK